MRTSSLRTVVGRVNADGTVAAFSGEGEFRVVRSAAGTYKLVFLPGFEGDPIIVPAPSGSGNAAVATSAAGQVVETRSAGALADAAFVFVASGPPASTY